MHRALPGRRLRSSSATVTTLVGILTLLGGALAVAWWAWARSDEARQAISHATTHTGAASIPRESTHALEQVELHLRNTRSFVADSTAEIDRIQHRIRQVGPRLKDNGYEVLYGRMVDADNRSLTVRGVSGKPTDELYSSSLDAPEPAAEPLQQIAGGTTRCNRDTTNFNRQLS